MRQKREWEPGKQLGERTNREGHSEEEAEVNMGWREWTNRGWAVGCSGL